MLISCQQCGNEFTRTGRAATTAKYCSRHCRSVASNARDIPCEICGVTFRSYGARAATARFCSPKCKGVAFRVMFTCEVCGKDSYGFRNRAKRYCSSACADRARTTGENRACKVCGTSFYVTLSRLATAEFCSRKCHNTHQGRNKTVHTCKVCGGEFRWSLSRTTSGNYRITYCSLPCRDADPEQRARLLTMQQQHGTTRAERDGYALLDMIGAHYLRQSPFAHKFTPDAVIPSARLVVQFDGDYWHDRKGTSTEPRILKRVALDQSQDAYVRACGWDVLRLWETDLRKHPAMCAAVLNQWILRPLGDAPLRDPLARV